MSAGKGDCRQNKMTGFKVELLPLKVHISHTKTKVSDIRSEFHCVPFKKSGTGISYPLKNPHRGGLDKFMIPQGCSLEKDAILWKGGIFRLFVMENMGGKSGKILWVGSD